MLEIEKYTAGYSKKQYLFDETTIKVLPGTVVGIKGTNGCGKSTFIKGIINLTPIKKGEIFLNGARITNWETRRIFRTKQIGYLSQRARVFGHLTVSEHIRLQQEYSIKTNSSDTYIYKKLFSIIESKKRFLASTLSGGEQLILNLICLIIFDPKVILLDEPSDSLDINLTKELIALILFWKTNDKSILLVEQNIDLLSSVCEKTIKLNNYE